MELAGNYILVSSLGRQTSITDAAGSRMFACNARLQLERETITGLYSRTLTRKYETGTMDGRNRGFRLDNGYDVTYGYDVKGRFRSVGWDVDGKSGAATYGYQANSGLIETVRAGGMAVTWGYEPKRNLKTVVENAFNTSVVSRYEYGHDRLGRREWVKNTGQAFEQSAFNRYGYNDRSEVTGSNRYLGTDVNDLSMPVDPEARIYAYDPIGNREPGTGDRGC